MAKMMVGVHQGSCLSLLLFIIVMGVISEHVRREVPLDMIYADDPIVADKGEAEIKTRFTDWQRASESKGYKININYTETMVCVKTNETLMSRDRNEHF